MVVSAARHQCETSGSQRFAQSLCVFHHLLLVLPEFGSLGLLQSHSQRSDGVVVRATLKPRKDGSIDLGLQVVHDWIALLVSTTLSLPEEDHRTTRTPQGFVG